MSLNKIKSVEFGDLLGVKLAVNQAPKLSVDLTQDIVKWGKSNKYPEQLLFWFENDAEHGSICRGKARYVTGKKIYSKNKNPQTEQWLKFANPRESWQQVRAKLRIDEAICGGYFLKIISNALGQPLYYYHLDFSRCRISPCQQFVRYCEDWSKTYQYGVIDYPVRRHGFVGASVFIYKEYSPSTSYLNSTYPKPEYLSGTLDIDTDTRISTFGNSLVSKSFTGGHIVEIANGETDEIKQKSIAERIKGNHEGEDEAGNTVVIFTDSQSGGKSTTVNAIQVDELDKKYEVISKRNQQKKISAHGVPAILFKIFKDGSQLNGNRKELIDAHELFLNEYVKVKQEVELRIIQNFYTERFGKVDELEIEQVEIIGVDWFDANVSKYLTTQEIREKLGLSNEGVVSQNGMVTKTEMGQEVNDSLKNLSGRQFQGLMRIVKKYDDQKLTKEQASILMVNGFGISSEEALTFLGIADEDDQLNEQVAKFEAQKKESIFFSLVEKYGHDINEEDEIVDIQEVNFSSMREAVRFEDQQLTNKKLKDSILNDIKGNPTVKESELQKKYGLTNSEVAAIIAALIAAGLVMSGTKTFEVTEKGLNTNTEDYGSEVYTEYVYDKRSDVSGPVLLSTSRSFCKDMVTLTKKKALTFEAINELNNEFGENAWDYRGGFYTKKNTKDTTPFCRHVWKAVTKIRRKK